jgi:uncharacterized membrane protein YgcG
MKLRISRPFKKEGIYYTDIKEAVDRLFEADGPPTAVDTPKEKPKEEKPKEDKKKPEEKKEIPGVPSHIKPVFPMDFILRKFPELKVILNELLTVTFKDYIENIFVVAPKPTTFKVLLKNEQWFLDIYMERSWVVKASGKKYYMLNIAEKERAIQAVADLLITKNFISSKNVEEESQSTGPDSASSEKGSSGGGSKGGGGASSGPDSVEDFSSADLDSILAGDEGAPADATEDLPAEAGAEEEPLAENIILRIR